MKLVKEINLDDGVTAELVSNILTINGPQGQVAKSFSYPGVTVKVAEGKIILSSPRASKREKKIIGSFQSHITNMVSGVQSAHVYKLKICSGHFPMNVSVSGEELIIKNFLGESVPRKVKLMPGATVKVEGVEITVTSPDKEAAGQTAAKIESLCRITNRDLRIFQDGCYITQKAGKVI
jgi:large subunit ribosomal protein L6